MIEMRIFHHERSLELMIIGWIMSVVNLGIPIEVLSDIWIGLLLENVRHISIHHLILMDCVWTIFLTFLLVICFN